MSAEFAPLLWDDIMSTGLAEVDVQHKELLEHFNRLGEALAQGKGRAETGEILDFLQFYAQWHFGREEACMDAYACPLGAANKAAHQDFVERFNAFYDTYHTTTPTRAFMAEAYDTLRTWIVNHIMRVDRQLRPCVLHQQRGHDSVPQAQPDGV